jgi:hypothetical protein
VKDPKGFRNPAGLPNQALPLDSLLRPNPLAPWELHSRADELDKHAEHAAWMRVPVVHASATGVIRTKLPLFYITLPV